MPKLLFLHILFIIVISECFKQIILHVAPLNLCKLTDWLLGSDSAVIDMLMLYCRPADCPENELNLLYLCCAGVCRPLATSPSHCLYSEAEALKPDVFIQEINTWETMS